MKRLYWLYFPTDALPKRFWSSHARCNTSQCDWPLTHYISSHGRLEQEIDRQLGVVLAVMQVLCQTIMVKKELSQKAKLSIYQSIYVPALTYGHELWVVTERMRLRIQAAEMSFLRGWLGSVLEMG